MTVVVPEPVPLGMPPEDPAALGDLVRTVAGTAYCLATVDGDLAGAAASAPHWLGDDARAATAQLDVVAALVRRCSTAVLASAGRLSAHLERVTAVRGTVAALRLEQDDDFAAAWARLGGLDDVVAAVRTDGPAAVSVVEELRAAEDARRRRHAALLADLRADAAATARQLLDSIAVIGARAGSGDAVTAMLAGELPGWGNAELTARGLALAGALTGGPVTAAEIEARARAAESYAGTVAFAGALLTALGADGVRYLLLTLGLDRLGGENALARVLAAAFGAAVPSGSSYDPVGEVLSATYVRPDGDGGSDVVVAGMTAVLAAGGSPGAAPRLATVAAWGRQMLVRERAQGAPAGSRVPADWNPAVSDPPGLVLRLLAAGGESRPAAALLADRDVWSALLARQPGADAGALGEVVRLAAADPTAAGDAAVRAGLGALGAGLDDGDPGDWTVDRGTAAALAPALGAAVAARVDVATVALGDAVDGRPGAEGADVLRGLGYLTLDRGAAAAVERALTGWARAQPVPLGSPGPLPPLPPVAIPAAYLAVEEYGQRLAYALHGFEAQQSAAIGSSLWNTTVGLAVTFLPGVRGTVAGVLADYAAMWLGLDGTWDVGTDRGLVLEQADAVRGALAALPAARIGTAGEVADQAAAGYERTAAVLGLPKPPTSPATHWWAPLLAALQPGPRDLPTPGRELRGLLSQSGLASLVGG